MILIVGGSGLLGHEVALRLLQSGEPVRVLTRTPQKAADLNEAGAEVASYLLLDAFQDAYDVAVIISNDSDLLVPVRMVKRDLGKVIGGLRVDKDDRVCVFAGLADFFKPLREAHFANNQFSNPVVDSAGKSIKKPPEWGLKTKLS